MVTDEMVGKASEIYALRTGAADKPALRAALEAALATTAEPVAYVCAADMELLAKTPEGLDISIAPKPYPELGMKMPLYAEPVKTAPAAAVKAIEAVWIKHDGKSMPVNAETVVEVRMAGGFEHEEDLAGNWLEREGSKSNWHYDLGCPHPCDIVAYRIVKGSPALSAQVQDVACSHLREILERWRDGCGFNEDSDEDVALLERASRVAKHGGP